jgi:diguanylate cyclase (GGDEF)-like protein
MDFTQSYWSMPWAALTMDSTMRAGSSLRTSELHGQRVAVVKGYSIESQLVDTGRIEVVSVSDIDEGIDRLRNRMVDSYVDSLPILVDELQEYPLPGSKLSVLDSTQGNALYLAVRDDWQPLVTILNRGINSLTPQQRDALKRKWYGYKLEQGWSDEELLELGMKIGSVVLLVILSFGIWNSRLRKEIKARKAAERHIRHIATHDELTGLPNRNLMQDRLEQSLRQSERTQKPFSVLFLDLDGFKQINDDFGHNYGDELLVQASQRMKTLLRRSDTVCRHGGDEFVVILPTAVAVGSALAVARKLVVQLAKPYKVKKQQLEVSVSIGVAMYPAHGTDVQKLLRSADKAMYAAKAAGKNDVRLASTDG